MVPFRSPQFIKTFEAGIEPDAVKYWDVGADNAQTAQYQPFNTCIIQSACSENIEVYLGDAVYLVPPNSNVTIPSYGINNVLIRNIGTAATSGKIRVTVWNDLNADMCLISQVTGIPIKDVMRGRY